MKATAIPEPKQPRPGAAGIRSLMLRADLRETCRDWGPWEAGGPCLEGSKQPGLACAVRVLALSPSDHAPSSGGGFLPLHCPVAVSDSSRGASGGGGGKAQARPSGQQVEGRGAAGRAEQVGRSLSAELDAARVRGRGFWRPTLGIAFPLGDGASPPSTSGARPRCWNALSPPRSAA